MKKKELFDRTISILVKAYMDGTLLHGNCYACAVGNLVAGHMGYGYVHNEIINEPVWNCEPNKKYNPRGTWFGLLNEAKHMSEKEIERANEQIAITGYTLKGISYIEHCFENPDEIDYLSSDNDGYFGLMSVCDALMQIHQCNETEITEAKQLFVKV